MVAVALLEMAVTKRCAALLLTILTLSSPAWAQPSSTDRPHRLVIDPSVVPVVPSSEKRPVAVLAPPSAPAPTFDVRPLIASVTGALSATPHLRAADAAVGTALIAFGTRRHHPMSSAVFLGVHALRLAAGTHVPKAWRGVDIQPDIGKDRVAITVDITPLLK